MRVVLDTNVYISSLIGTGKPRAVVESSASGGFDLIVSEPILIELARILSNKFGWPESKIRAAAKAIRDIAEAVEPKRVLTDCIDPSDNRILEAAVEGHADCIVSGDKHLLRMNPFRSIEILNANDFLLRVGSPRSEAR